MAKNRPFQKGDFSPDAPVDSFFEEKTGYIAIFAGPTKMLEVYFPLTEVILGQKLKIFDLNFSKIFKIFKKVCFCKVGIRNFAHNFCTKYAKIYLNLQC